MNKPKYGEHYADGYVTCVHKDTAWVVNVFSGNEVRFMNIRHEDLGPQTLAHEELDIPWLMHKLAHAAHCHQSKRAELEWELEGVRKKLDECNAALKHQIDLRNEAQEMMEQCREGFFTWSDGHKTPWDMMATFELAILGATKLGLLGAEHNLWRYWSNKKRSRPDDRARSNVMAKIKEIGVSYPLNMEDAAKVRKAF